MLTPYLPFPLLSGGQIRSYNLLKNLSQKHQITLVSLIKHESEKQYIRNISPFCKKVVVSKRPEKPWTIANILKTGFGKYPFLVVRNFSPQAKEAVIKELRDKRYDLIHAETFYVMPHIPQTEVPILMVEQTIEYLVYQHFVDTMRFLPMRILFSLDVYKIRHWEKYFWKQAKRVIAMSASDEKVMQTQVPRLHVSIVPNGVDQDFFTFQKKVIRVNPKVLFIGNFKWLQNREAVTKLVQEIWPKITSKLPRVTLLIVGKYPTREILDFKSSNIEVKEDIEDIRSAYTEANLLLAPIYGPGGTRYKILEAMACGLPVVTTPYGIEGLGVTDGKEGIICKTSDELASATVDVLTNPDLYSRLANTANRLVRNLYNWEKIGQKLDSIYEEVAHEPSS